MASKHGLIGDSQISFVNNQDRGCCGGTFFASGPSPEEEKPIERSRTSEWVDFFLRRMFVYFDFAEETGTGGDLGNVVI